MKTNSSAEAAIHIVLLLAFAPSEVEISTSDLADFHELSRTTLAKVLQQLSAANIVIGSAGRTGGYRLARRPSEISVYEVAAAIDGVEPRFHCHEIRKKGPCAEKRGQYSTRCAIARTMDAATRAWQDTLSGVSIAQLAQTTALEVPDGALGQTRKWLDINARSRSKRKI